MAKDGSIGVLEMASTPPLAPRATKRRGVVALALLAVAWCLAVTPIRSEYDSHLLYEGLFSLIMWGRGGFAGPVEAAFFPPFQYLTGLPAVLAGMYGFPANVFTAWGYASLISFGCLGFILYRVARVHASATVAWVLVIVLLTGPLVTYAPSTFNELPAALVTAGFAAVVTGSGGALAGGVLFVAAGLTKEIAAPLLVPIWLAGLWLRREQLTRADVARHTIAMAGAFAATVAAHAGFNWIRFDSVLNLHYLQEHHLIRPWDRRAQNIVAVWLAPNGGVIAFWPTLAILVTGAAVVAAASGKQVALWRARLSRLVPAIAVAATLGGLTLGLSGFYQPFGWWAWGPRLMLPWLPAALLVLVRAYPQAFQSVARALLERRLAFVVTATLACALALPHLLMLATPATMTAFFEPDPQFPHGADPAQAELHYERQVFLAWRKWPPALTRPLGQLPTPLAASATGAYLVGIIILLWRARECLLGGFGERHDALMSPHSPAASPRSGRSLRPAAHRWPAET